MPETRKVAAILVADIVGFSRLAGADEERTLARLRTLRSDLIDPTIAIHNGRLIKRTGDGAVVEFRSVVEAVRAAIDVQSGLADRNAGLAAGQRIDVRVGIHLGDVVEETDGDLMGDGVNVAARLQAICEPGGVCLSEDAYRQVRDKLQATFADLGEQTLKNIARPVRAYALKPGGFAGAPPPTTKPRGRPLLWSAVAGALVIALIAAGWFGWRKAAPPPTPAPVPVAAVADEKLARAPRLSIVVLPFANLSGDPEQDYFADGLTDDLTTDLSHIPDSFVIGRSTAAAYKGKPVELKQLGRDLGVRYALEGSVRRVGEAITINAQLVSTETGAHLWADRFEGDRGKLGALQVEAVARIANALGVQLVNAEALRAARERPTNPDATDLAMRGWVAFNSGVTLDNLNKAIGFFDDALRIDPDLPRALNGKALAQMHRLWFFQVGDKFEVVSDAVRSADRVLASRPDDAMAHLVKAVALNFKQQNDAALTNANAAIAIDRNFAGAYGFKGYLTLVSGRAAEAVEQLEQALRLDPLDPGRDLTEYNLCKAHAHLAHWDQAIEWCGKAAADNPSNLYPNFELAASYAWLGRRTEASNAVARLEKLLPGVTVKHYLGMNLFDSPVFVSGRDRIIEGLRKAGLPENSASARCGGAEELVHWRQYRRRRGRVACGDRRLRVGQDLQRLSPGGNRPWTLSDLRVRPLEPGRHDGRASARRRVKI